MSTAFQWPLSEVIRYARIQSETLVTTTSEVGPAIRLAATVLATLAGAGLCTFLLALSSVMRVPRGIWRGIQRLRDGSVIGTASSIAGADWSVFLLPLAAQTVLIVAVKLFDARYVDLLPAFVAAIAGVQASRVAQTPRLTWRWSAGMLAVLVGYQLIYAAGIVRRYTSDSRVTMNQTLPSLLPSGARVAASPYIPITHTMKRYSVLPRPMQGSAEWVVSMDMHAARYLTHSGSFVALGKPADCSAVYNCEGEPTLQFGSSRITVGLFPHSESMDEGTRPRS